MSLLYPLSWIKLLLQTERNIRFVGLSTALANAQDLADWLGIKGPASRPLLRSPCSHLHSEGPAMLPPLSLPVCLSAAAIALLPQVLPLLQTLPLRQPPLLAAACYALRCLQGLFNFKPSVRPVPLEVHIQVGGMDSSI